VRKFTFEYVNSFGPETRDAAPRPYKPFPGKIPTRLNVRLRIYNPATDKWRVRFWYSGKFSTSVIVHTKKLYEVGRQLGNELSLWMQEYHQNGMIMTYNGGTTTLYHYHNLAHVDSLHPVGTRQWLTVQPIFAEEVPFKFGNFSMMVPKALITTGKEWQGTVSRIRRTRRNNEMGIA